MFNTKRFVIKIAGESGQGINSIGEILSFALKNSGYYIFGYREYPSLIKGGHATYQIDFSDSEINSSSNRVDIGLSINRYSVHKILKDIKEGGILIHTIARFSFDSEELEYINSKNIKVFYIDVNSILKNIDGIKILENTIMTEILALLLGLDTEIIKKAFEKKFGNKKNIIDVNFKAIDEAQKYALDIKIKLDLKRNKKLVSSLITTGNHGISLGAVSAGVRAFYSYPMTPSSSILEYLAEIESETGMIVKQAEDEITAVQMALGSMHMGTRALTATSGGGFDLMTESISMAGITEIPCVIILAQRPGPATGLPTWTAATDLNLAVYAGHGEFSRCVLAAHDLESAYLVIQQAFNISEKYQIPVIVLTEKQIAESLFQIEKFPKAQKIERHLTEEDSENLLRYKITESGISPRWIPGKLKTTYNANSDEHSEDGKVTEAEHKAEKMYEKRLRKLQYLTAEIPEPELTGPEKGDVLFVGWGSVRNTVEDAMKLINDDSEISVSYLHYEYVYPVKTEKLLQLAENFEKVVLIESNHDGQFGNLLKLACNIEFTDKLLKYNGRPFFLEDVLDYLNYGRKLSNPLTKLLTKSQT